MLDYLVCFVYKFNKWYIYTKAGAVQVLESPEHISIHVYLAVYVFFVDR